MLKYVWQNLECQGHFCVVYNGNYIKSVVWELFYASLKVSKHHNECFIENCHPLLSVQVNSKYLRLIISWVSHSGCKCIQNGKIDG